MERQLQILRAFEGNFDLVLTKYEIKHKAEVSYYANTDKHLGETLSRMVKNGSLLRIKRGHYKLSKLGKRKINPIPDNQKNLFDQ